LVFLDDKNPAGSPLIKTAGKPDILVKMKASALIRHEIGCMLTLISIGAVQESKAVGQICGVLSIYPVCFDWMPLRD